MIAQFVQRAASSIRIAQGARIKRLKHLVYLTGTKIAVVQHSVILRIRSAGMHVQRLDIAPPPWTETMDYIKPADVAKAMVETGARKPTLPTARMASPSRVPA